MNRKRSTLWGLIGALSFLVLHQAYLIAGGTFVGYLPVVLVAVVVGVVAGATSYWLEPRIAELVAGE